MYVVENIIFFLKLGRVSWHHLGIWTRGCKCLLAWAKPFKALNLAFLSGLPTNKTAKILFIHLLYYFYHCEKGCPIFFQQIFSFWRTCGNLCVQEDSTFRDGTSPLTCLEGLRMMLSKAPPGTAVCPHRHRAGSAADRQWCSEAADPLRWGTAASPI